MGRGLTPRDVPGTAASPAPDLYGYFVHTMRLQCLPAGKDRKMKVDHCASKVCPAWILQSFGRQHVQTDTMNWLPVNREGYGFHGCFCTFALKCTDKLKKQLYGFVSRSSLGRPDVTYQDKQCYKQRNCAKQVKG